MYHFMFQQIDLHLLDCNLQIHKHLVPVYTIISTDNIMFYHRFSDSAIIMVNMHDHTNYVQSGRQTKMKILNLRKE